MLSKKNRVIIRIWNSGINGGENVGHVSIETPNEYISLWPQGHPAGKIKRFFETREHGFIPHVEMDNQLELRTPEITVCLYGLDVDKIEKKFIWFKENIEGWTLFGGNRLLNNSSAKSCSSLALDVLKEGGLGANYLVFSSSVTPDKLAEAAIAEKKREIADHPDTLLFKFDGEYDVMENRYEKVTCSIL